MRIEHQILWATVALQGLPAIAWLVAEMVEFLQEIADQTEWHP